MRAEAENAWVQNRKARGVRAFLGYVVTVGSEVALGGSNLGLLVGALALLLGADHGEVLLALLLTGLGLLAFLGHGTRRVYVGCGARTGLLSAASSGA